MNYNEKQKYVKNTFSFLVLLGGTTFIYMKGCHYDNHNLCM